MPYYKQYRRRHENDDHLLHLLWFVANLLYNKPNVHSKLYNKYTLKSLAYNKYFC